MSLTRRDFLKYTLAGAAAAKLGSYTLGALGQESKPASLPASRPGELPRRVLGKTKEAVTILGMGTAYIAVKGKDKPDEDAIRKTLETALEGGVRYFDTSPDYQQSEIHLGPVLAPHREDLFLTTKINPSKAADAEKELTRSLELLKTDHVDLLLQHCVQPKHSKPEEMLASGGSIEFLRKAKEKGMTRFIGMSVHSPYENAYQVLDAVKDFDVVMPFVNYIHQATSKNAQGELIERCRKDNIGIVAMKTLGGQGQLADDYDRAFRYTLSVPGVTCALIGVHSPDEVRRAIQAAKDFRPLTDAEMAEAVKYGQKLVDEKDPKVLALLEHMPRDLGSFLNGQVA